MNENTVGKTKNTGYEIGVRKIIKCTLEKIWEYLCSKEGLNIWLGTTNLLNITKDQKFKTEENIKGMFRIIEHQSHLRLTWKKMEWNNLSTLQIRVLGSKNGTVVSFHQENLADYNQREEMKERWTRVLDKISIKME
jgi:uncharacterized protein YndB with AHSA1/START domain